MTRAYLQILSRVHAMRELLDLAKGYSEALDAIEHSAKERAYQAGKPGPSPSEIRDYAEARQEIAKLRAFAIADLDKGLHGLRQERVRRVLEVIPEALDVADGPLLEALEKIIEARQSKKVG